MVIIRLFSFSFPKFVPLLKGKLLLQGFRTGYMFKQPMVRTDQVRLKSEVEVPPAASSYSQYFGEDKWLR